MEKPNSIFKPSVVAYADVLGVSVATEKPDRAELIGRRLLKVHKILNDSNIIGGDIAAEKISVKFYSDSIIFIGNLIDTQKTTSLYDNVSVPRILNKMRMIQALFAVNGLFLRGVVAIGPMLSIDTVDFGAPLVQAVKIEANRSPTSAKICLSEELVKIGENFEFDVLVDRIDDTVFLDFMGAITKASHIQKLRSAIESEIAFQRDNSATPAENDKALKKLEWLARYFNSNFSPKEKIVCATVEKSDFQFLKH